MNLNIKHIPVKGNKDIEQLIASYGIVKFNNGESQIRVCFRNKIDKSMASSRGSTRDDYPWKKYFEAMTLVVPIRKTMSFG